MSNSAFTKGQIALPVPVASGGTGTSSNTANAILTGGGASPINSTGVTIDASTNLMYGFGAKINAQTGTTYTLLSTDNGKIVEVSNASAITITLPNNLAQGFNCLIVQTGAGQITLSAQAGGALHNRSSFTKTAGQYAMLSLYISTNSGTNASYIMCGDGA